MRSRPASSHFLRSTSRRLSLASLLILALALPACGDKERGGAGPTGGTTVGKTREVSTDLGKLVPGDAVVFVYAPSLDALLADVRALVKTVQPGAENELTADALRQQMPGGEHVDFGRPIGFAVSPGAAGGDPNMTMVIPAKDPAKAKAALEGMMPTLVTSGSYLVASTVQGYAPGSSAPPIARTAPLGDLGIRVDLAKVNAIWGKDVENMLGEMSEMMPMGPAGTPGAPDMGEMMKGMGAAMRSFLASSETLDLAFVLEGSAVDVNLALTVKDGSDLVWKGSVSPEGLDKLAGMLPEGGAMSGLVALEPSALIEMNRAFLDLVKDAMPGGMSEAMGPMMERWSALAAHTTGRTALTMDIGPKGLRLASVVQAKDEAAAKAYATGVQEMFSSGEMAAFGIRAAPATTETVEGVTVTVQRIEFDMSSMVPEAARSPEAQQAMDEAIARMYPDGLLFHWAVVGNNLVYAMGDKAWATTAVTRAKKGGKITPGLAAAMQKAGGKPSMLLHLDLRRLMAGMFAMMRSLAPEAADSMPAMEDGPAAPIVLHVTMDGRVYRGGLSLDVGAIMKAVQPMMQGTRSGGMRPSRRAGDAPDIVVEDDVPYEDDMGDDVFEEDEEEVPAGSGSR